MSAHAHKHALTIPGKLHAIIYVTRIMWLNSITMPMASKQLKDSDLSTWYGAEFGRELSIFNEALLNNKDYVIIVILKVKKSYMCLSSNIRLQVATI